MALICIYFLVLAVFYFGQDKLLFVPAKEYAALPSDMEMDFEEVSIEVSGNNTLAIWKIPANKAVASRGTLLFFHGNKGNLGDRVLLLKHYHSMGFKIIAVHVRGYGKSSGKPTQENIIEDFTAIKAFLEKTENLKLRDLTVLGRSLGGAIAIQWSIRHLPKFLILESTFTSVYDMVQVTRPWLCYLFPIKHLLRHPFWSISLIDKIKCPIVLMHSREDDLIPFSQSETLFAKITSKNKKFIEVYGDHGQSSANCAVDSKLALLSVLG